LLILTDEEFLINRPVVADVKESLRIVTLVRASIVMIGPDPPPERIVRAVSVPVSVSFLVKVMVPV
jgi:hypothetical protein